jgi:peptidyl-prolyl cis-trans isomerase C
MKTLSVLAHVNGVELPYSLLEQAVRNNKLQQLPDNDETRLTIKNELIAREVLSQKAVELGLENSDAFRSQMALYRQLTLAEMALVDHLTKNPVTEADVRKDYERQVELLKEAIEYKLSSIVASTQENAQMALRRLLNGEAFADVAREVSIESSKDHDGNLGWLLPHQIIPLVSNVAVNLSPGDLVAAPIQSPSGWHIVRLEETRPYVIPSFDAVKDQVRNGLIQQQRVVYINQRIAEAQIVA